MCIRDRYQGVPLEEWALTDPKYTDSETGISWYIRDGKYPYMVDVYKRQILFIAVVAGIWLYKIQKRFS